MYIFYRYEVSMPSFVENLSTSGLILKSPHFQAKDESHPHLVISNLTTYKLICCLTTYKLMCHLTTHKLMCCLNTQKLISCLTI